MKGHLELLLLFAVLSPVLAGDAPSQPVQVRRVDLATKYNRIISKAAGMGMLRAEQQSLEHYVTDKTLDGLYFMIGQEEKKIRRDPIGTGSALLGKVFGTLR